MRCPTAAAMLTAVLLLSACNLRQGPAPSPTLSPEEIIATAVQATAEVFGRPSLSRQPRPRR